MKLYLKSRSFLSSKGIWNCFHILFKSQCDEVMWHEFCGNTPEIYSPNWCHTIGWWCRKHNGHDVINVLPVFILLHGWKKQQQQKTWKTTNSHRYVMSPLNLITHLLTNKWWVYIVSILKKIDSLKIKLVTFVTCINDLVQDYDNSITNALELPKFCKKPSICMSITMSTCYPDHYCCGVLAS